MSKPIPVAVVILKEAGTLRLALGPNIIPVGFIKKRLEFPPMTWMRPLIIEASPPVILPRMLRVSGVERKLAVWPELRLNWSKLWKRFAPSLLRVPPSMLNSLPWGVTMVLVSSFAEVMGWELAGSSAANTPKIIVRAVIL